MPHFEPAAWEVAEDTAVAAPPTLHPPAREKRPGSHSHLLTGLLLALVLLQAAPSFLWLKERLAGPITMMAAQDVEAPDPQPPVAPAAPCEPAAAVASEPRPGRPAARPVGTTSAAAPPALSAGLIAVAAPVPMHVYAKGKLIGTTEAETIMLPVGSHNLDFVNDALGYRTSRRVAVQAARTTQVRLDAAPTGTLNVNAAPWAEVWIDNQRIGETPIGNFRVPIGQREVRFRHPELGERSTTVLVTLKQPARVSMDLRQP